MRWWRSPSRRSAAARTCRTCRSRCRRSPQQTLQQLNVATLDDYLKYLPNVTTANNGPGQNEIFMRGLSAGSQPSQGSASTGLWPNVAIYLDNQSGQLAQPQPRHLRGRPQSHRGAGRSAGHPVRRRRRGRRHPLHHQRAEARRGRGQRHRRLRHHRARRPQQQRHGGAQPAADRRRAWRCARWSTTTGAAATSTTCRRPSRARTPTSASTTRNSRR